jgi:hypothetical protein
MTRWIQKQPTDVAIRAAGALCCGASYLAVGGLAHLRIATHAAQPGALAYALAAIAFLGASAGAMLVVLGHHIFDQVQVSGRWQHRPIPIEPRLQGRGDADCGLADSTSPTAGADAQVTPRAVATATDLPLPWRTLDVGVRRSTDLRTARRS